MDFCRNNASLSSSTPPADYFQGFPAPAASSSSPSPSQLDDLFPSHTAEVDLSLEWLSVFVEDCLTSTGNCLPLPSITNNNNNAPTPTNPSLVAEEKKKQRQPLEEKENSPSTGLHKLFVVPGKARSKRKRVTSYKTTTGSSSGRRRTHHQNYDSTTLTSPWSQPFLHYSVDPPMLQQEYWLADSELIFPKSEGSTTTNNNSSSSSSRGNELNTGNQVMASSVEEEEKDKEEKKKKVVIWKKEGMEEGSNHDDDGGQEQQGQGRRCSHCLSQRTPQWRAGPLGPKTLCNACGVRYKSGRLLPEYRPAKSPTFVSFLHSNSHKKVLEMRSCGSASTTP